MNAREQEAQAIIETWLDGDHDDARRMREMLSGSYCCGNLRKIIAAALEAKEGEVERLKEQRDRLHADALGYLAKYTCTPEEGYLNAPHCLSNDIDRLGKERDQLKALLKEAVGIIAGLKESLHHMEACRWCGEDWNDCDGGTRAFSRLGDAATFLSKPEIAELK